MGQKDIEIMAFNQFIEVIPIAGCLNGDFGLGWKIGQLVAQGLSIVSEFTPALHDAGLVHLGDKQIVLVKIDTNVQHNCTSLVLDIKHFKYILKLKRCNFFITSGLIPLLTPLVRTDNIVIRFIASKIKVV